MCPVSALAHLVLTDPSFLTVTKGIGANMLKMSSKRRRTKAQVKADRKAEEAREA